MNIDIGMNGTEGGAAAPMNRRQVEDALRAMLGRQYLYNGRPVRVLRGEAGEDAVRLVCDRRDVAFPLAAAARGLADFLPVSDGEADGEGDAAPPAAIAAPAAPGPLVSRHAEGLVDIVRRNIDRIAAAGPGEREDALRTAEGIGGQVRILVDVFRAEVDAIRAMAAMNGHGRERGR